ncbi:DNA primase/helicase [Salmonella phage NINP13076]|nr:DNA primase/helicase [Salmonella phage NINP13076]
MSNFDFSAYRQGGQENPKAQRFGNNGNRGGRVSYQQREEETLESVVNGTRILAVPEMSLSLDAAKYFKIRSAVSASDGVTITATYLPYYDKYGKLTGYKKRDWTII